MQRRNCRGVSFGQASCPPEPLKIFAGHFPMKCPAGLSSSYLSAVLKLDNLARISDNRSEKVSYARNCQYVVVSVA